MGGGHAKIDGAQRKITGAWAKIDGVWKKGGVVSSRIDGVWQEAWKNAFERPDFLSYPATITRGQTFTWNTEDIIGADYELQARYNDNTEWGPSTFHTTNSGSYTASGASVNNVSLQLRVRAVAPTTHDKQSAWVEGPVRSLGAQILAEPIGLTYTTSITRGDTVKVSWTNTSNDITYAILPVYTRPDGTKSLAESKTSKGIDFLNISLSAFTGWDKVEFRIKASRMGYIDSDWVTGPIVTLKAEQLEQSIHLVSPWNPYQGQTITVSWDAVAKATQYQLELRYDTGVWASVYRGPNRSYSRKISDTAKEIQWRVRPAATGYLEGPWTTTKESPVALPPLKVTTWTASLVRSWRSKEDWGWRDPGDSGGSQKMDRMYQGSWNEPPWWGNHRGLAFFDSANMRATLAGKDIIKVRIYFYRINAGGYVAGQGIKLWTHNYTGVPAGMPALTYVQGTFSSFARGEGKWIIVNNSIAERIRDNTAKGIALYREDQQGYLFMSDNVKIEVTYR